MTGVSVERLDAVGIVTIDRPSRRNALSVAMLTEVASAVEALALECSAVVLTGSGGFFSAGVDLAELGRGARDAEVDAALAACVGRVSAVGVPTVAAIEGGCLGGAVEVALACDARVMADDSYLSVPAVSLGILYRPEGLARLVRRFGAPAVTRLLLFADRVPADAALGLGLATDRCARGTARATAEALARAVPSATSRAVEATKRLLVSVGEGVDDAAAWEATRHELLEGEERRAALARARDRRPKDA